MTPLMIVLTVIYVIFCLFLIAVVLLQSGKSAGLSGAISGLREAFQTAYTNNDTVAFDSLRTVSDKLREEMNASNLDFIKNHPDSYISVTLLEAQRSDLDFDELKALYNGLTPDMQALAESTGKYINALESIQAGKPAPMKPFHVSSIHAS